MSYNLDLPQERARCVEDLGMAGYSKLLREHHEKQVVANVYGRKVRAIVTSRFGTLFSPDGTESAFSTLDLALDWCKLNPVADE